MSQDNQSDQPHVTREMFDITNVSQPAPAQGIPGSVTPANIEIPAPRPQTPPAQSNFTVDNLEIPVTTTELTQEGNNE